MNTKVSAVQPAPSGHASTLSAHVGGPFDADDADVVGARRSASVLVLRDSPAGLEVLLMRRAVRQGDTRSGVWVFPGGVLEPSDAQARAETDAGRELDRVCSAHMKLPWGGLDYEQAARRECFEEVALEISGPLAYFDHWLTPPGLPQRFDTRFFLAEAPLDQVARIHDGEARELRWLRPVEALSAGLKLLPVTQSLLSRLAQLPPETCANDALTQAQQRVGSIDRCMGRVARTSDEQGDPLSTILRPDHPAWAEVGRLDPSGRGDVVARLVPGRVVWLSPRVARVTCDNGSVMTGPGTNTYVVGDPQSDRCVVLDPGPHDARTTEHLRQVMGAVGQRTVSHILVSHTHRDHSPAARTLREWTGATVVGQLAKVAEGQDADFAPNQSVNDGDLWDLGPHCHLRAVLTPGHASNHVCWWLLEERLLFTGDHIMQGSTVVIHPPDGDMAAYLSSLKALLSLDLVWLAPGHGFLMAHPAREVERIIAHRLAREAKVLRHVEQSAPWQGWTVEELLAPVYGDVHPARHGIAARSLLAHLIKLQDEGLVRSWRDERGLLRWAAKALPCAGAS